MKNYLLILTLFLSVFCFSQTSFNYSSHYLKQSDFKGLQKLNNPVSISNNGEGKFFIKAFMGSVYGLLPIDINLRYNKTIDMFGNPLYEYKGTMSNGKHQFNCYVETSKKLSVFAEGIQTLDINYLNELEEILIKVLYWDMSINEPLIKNTIEIYPINKPSKTNQNNFMFSLQIDSKTFNISKKGGVFINDNNTQKQLISEEEYTSLTDASYYLYNEYLLLELGEGSEEGYFYKVCVINLKNNSHWIFDNTCANWEDMFCLKEDKIYYVCEHHCENDKIYQLDLINQKSKEIVSKDCGFALYSLFAMNFKTLKPLKQ